MCGMTARPHRIEARALVLTDRRIIAELFPVFVAPGVKPRVRAKVALKIGIVDDLARETGWPVARCRAVLDDYTNGTKYHRALIEGDGVRYDLEGQPAGEVTQAQRDHAATRLRQLEARYRDHRHRQTKRKAAQHAVAA
jgi:sRNA-binding protein